jgi:hypothetical protein
MELIPFPTSSFTGHPQVAGSPTGNTITYTVPLSQLGNPADVRVRAWEGGTRDPGSHKVVDVVPDAGVVGISTGLGGSAGPGPTPAGTVVLAASASDLTFSPPVFRAASSGPSAKATAKKLPPIGARVTYKLNGAANVRFIVQQTRPGRVHGTGKKATCVAPTKANAKAKKCSRVVTLPGSFTQAGKAGTNQFRFTGRMGGRKLKPGKYTLVATPTANGKPGKATKTAFRISK